MTTTANRNDQLNDSSYAIGQFVGAGGLSYSDAMDRLYGAASANGYVKKDGSAEARATIKSGLDAGTQHPRSIPSPAFDDDWVYDKEEAAEAVEWLLAHWENKKFDERKNFDSEEDADLEPEDIAVDGLPKHLCQPPGAVGEVVDFIVSAARKPSATLALASALAFTSALIGRRYKGPTGLRSNVYIVGLAPSGFGKDITIRAPHHLATAAGPNIMRKFIGSDIASVQGLKSRLREDPSIVYQIDEFGKFLERTAGRRASINDKQIATALLTLTGAAGSEFGATDRAAERQEAIHHPSLSLYGVSTPHSFWQALASGNIDEGLLGRLIALDNGTKRPVTTKPSIDVEQPPQPLIDTVRSLIGLGAKANLFGLYNRSGGEPPDNVVSVPFGDGAEEAFEEFCLRIEKEMDRTRTEHQPILSRLGENSIRLSLIVAVGVNPNDPIITAEIQAWANDVAEHSGRTLIKGAREHIAENESHAEYLKIKRYIEHSGKEGISRSVINHRINGTIELRRIESILTQLRTTREVVEAKHVSPKGQTRHRFWLRKHLPKGAQEVG